MFKRSQFIPSGGLGAFFIWSPPLPSFVSTLNFNHHKAEGADATIAPQVLHIHTLLGPSQALGYDSVVPGVAKCPGLRWDD